MAEDKATDWVRLIADHAKTLELILDGLVAEWRFAYSVHFDSGHELPIAGNQVDFCHAVRQCAEGNGRCKTDEAQAAQQAVLEKRPRVFYCHAGLLNIAVPLFVDGQNVATLICGKRRTDNPEQERKSQQSTLQIEDRLKLPAGQLFAARQQIPVVSEALLPHIVERLEKGALVIGGVLRDLKELDAKTAEMDVHVREVAATASAAGHLNQIVPLEIFWKRVNKSLRDICKAIGAELGLIMVSSKGDSDQFVIRSASTPKRSDMVGSAYRTTDCELLHKVVVAGAVLAPDLSAFIEDRLVLNISADLPGLSSAVLIHFDLSTSERAILALFGQHRPGARSSLPFEQEMSLLKLFTPQFANAYQNCTLVSEIERVERERRRFLQDVTHQLVGPLMGIMAHAENLQQGFVAAERIQNVYTDLLEQSRSTALRAKDFARFSMMLEEDAGGPMGASNLVRARITDVLIACARDVQGLGRSRRIQVHVDTTSVDALPELILDSALFRQAITNLLDNAVKYSDPGTQVAISAAVDTRNAYLYFTNYGIPITPADQPRLFERYFRTDEARKRVPHGTGIGLVIAQKIIQQHGGEVSVKPSELDGLRYRTTFSIRLPKA
jgi:signal transduction histidine kinase/ligand-binding sensor protein